MRHGWRAIAILMIACQPKQPLQPSFFTAKRADNAPLTCTETLDCYGECKPLVEECLLRCDQRAAPPAVERSRAAANCVAMSGCTDRDCEEQRCGAERQACIEPARAVAPSPMRPAPVMRPQPMQPHGAHPPPREPVPPGGEPMPPRGEPRPP